MSIAQNLKAAKELISNPENWFKGDFQDETGCKFCMIGAIEKAKNPNGAFYNTDSDEVNFITQVWKPDYHRGLDRNIADFNDAPETTHADVMTMFDKAIAKAEIEKV